MLQKIQKKLQEFLKEKGQGVIEYALVLGVVAIIAVYLIGQGNLQDKTKNAIGNVDAATSILKSAMDTAYTGAAAGG